MTGGGSPQPVVHGFSSLYCLIEPRWTTILHEVWWHALFNSTSTFPLAQASATSPVISIHRKPPLLSWLSHEIHSDFMTKSWNGMDLMTWWWTTKQIVCFIDMCPCFRRMSFNECCMVLNKLCMVVNELCRFFAWIVHAFCMEFAWSIC